MSLKEEIQVLVADYLNPNHGRALVELLDAYAKDPAGGGQGLSEFTHNRLVSSLAKRPQAFSILAFAKKHGQADLPIGLVNCFEGFSTFACMPLVNVHDVAVIEAFRGQGVAELMLNRVIEVARKRGACKLTLEVLSGNQAANKLYQRMGFEAYQLDPGMGVAHFLQKKLID